MSSWQFLVEQSSHQKHPNTHREKTNIYLNPFLSEFSNSLARPNFTSARFLKKKEGVSNDSTL